MGGAPPGDGCPLASEPWPPGAGGLRLCIDFLLHGVDGDGQLVGVVGGLLDQMLQDAKTSVEGGLEPLHVVKELLDLGLQLDHFLGRGMRGDRRGCESERERCGGEKAVTDGGKS